MPTWMSRSNLPILTALTRSGTELSANECAAEVAIPRVGARRYLEHFVQQGKVVVTPSTGRSGGPERRYAIGAAGSA